jgi:hypothetical protein
MVVGEVGVAIVRYFMCYVVAFENPLRPEIRNYFAGELMEQGLYSRTSLIDPLSLLLAVPSRRSSTGISGTTKGAGRRVRARKRRKSTTGSDIESDNNDKSRNKKPRGAGKSADKPRKPRDAPRGVTLVMHHQKTARRRRVSGAAAKREIRKLGEITLIAR